MHLLAEFWCLVIFILSGTHFLLGYISQHDPQGSVGLSPQCPSLAVWASFPLPALTSPALTYFWPLEAEWHCSWAESWRQSVVCWNTVKLWGSWEDQAQEIDLKFLANECFEHHLITSWKGKGKRQLINYLLWIISSAIMVIKQSLQTVSFS